VRALYLDIAHWAVDDPGRWAPWAVPCPISDAEIGRAKELKHRKARMDQRTRERLPVLPVLVRTAHERRLATERRLQAAQDTQPGDLIPDTNGALRKAITPTSIGRHVWAEDTATGKRRNLSYEDEEAFWSFSTIEVLRLTGIRCEEMLELSHHSITEYRLPSTGELVPLLQIAPSKTDTERLLLVSPELTDVLSAMVSRLRAPNGAIPLVAAYDIRERVWNAPMPLLFQRSIGSENRPFTPTAIRKLLINALAATDLTDASGDPLMFSPHDFRRIFVTDAIMSGLPPHIAQVICGHKSIDTTMGYKAVYPAEAIEAHRAFIARRRTTDQARNIGPRPIKNGTPSSRTSRKGRCQSGPAHELSDRLASMSTPVSGVHCYALTQHNDCGWRRSATIWRPELSRPSAKAGSGKSKDCKSA
jgi:hypothetical protein